MAEHINAIARVRNGLEAAESDPDVQLHELLLDINEQFARLMQAHGIRRSELAERLGTSRSFVTRILDGNENVTLKTLLRVAAALDARVELRVRAQDQARDRQVAGNATNPQRIKRRSTRARPAAAARSRRPSARPQSRSRTPTGSGR